MIQIFLYNHIPGTNERWTLAVYATGRKDANNHVKSVWRGGRFICKLEPGAKVNANCGSTTDAAQVMLRENFERFMEG